MSETPNDKPNGSGGAHDGIFNHAAPEGHAKRMSEVLGEITWLMSQSPLHKQMFIADLEWMVMTPVLLQQFRLYYAKDRPVGVVFWANASPEVAARLAAGDKRMRPGDWQSGDEMRVVDVVAPFGGAEEMVRDARSQLNDMPIRVGG